MPNEHILIIALLILSVLFLVPIVISFFLKVFAKGEARTGINRVLVVLVCLIASVWCLRYAVGYYSALSPSEDNPSLTEWEEIGNSFAHALQTFSMDEDYEKYIKDGKAMLRDIFGSETGIEKFYGIYASILNLVAPVAGGAIIFEVISGIFPKLKLLAYCLAIWKDKYYFSELNVASLSVLKSIRSEKYRFLCKPTVVFTDAYVDSDNENSSEMILIAKSYGAICLRDDIVHVSKNRFGKRKFFLIDESEINNLKTLTQLVNGKDVNYLLPAEIYLFCESEAYSQIENQVQEKLKIAFENKKSFFCSGKVDRKPIIVPIQRYRNMISNLLCDLPLYEPIAHRVKNDSVTELNISVLGTGAIGTEMLLSSYWFCQMLNVKTNITVVSKESEGEFWNKIDTVNPEIRKSVSAGDPILECYNGKSTCSEPYCKVNYIPCDVYSSEFVGMMNNERGASVSNSDYILVSLGSDEKNITVADSLRKLIGNHHMVTKTDRKTIITYVVYDSDLANTLNQKKRHYFISKEEPDLFMQAIGNLDELYNIRGLLMVDHLAQAKICYQSAESHAKLSLSEQAIMVDARRTSEVSGSKSEGKPAEYKSDYIYWARLARAMHKKYKAFSVGLVEKSVFCYSDSDFSEYRTEQTELLKRYRDYVVAKRRLSKNSDSEMELLHKLSWLEHRRWCAFTRTMGFRGCDCFETYNHLTGRHQNWELKLHPTLVECDAFGMRPVAKPNNIYWEEYFACPKDIKSCEACEKCTQRRNGSERDKLDLMSARVNALNKNGSGRDFKINDYPFDDFPDLGFEEICDLFNVEEDTLKTAFSSGKITEYYLANPSDIKTVKVPQTQSNIEAIIQASNGSSR